MNETLLSVAHLKVKFDGHLILDDISFEIKKTQTLAVIGPNGAGKTVLFRAILGLIPYEGEVKWAHEVKIGYVPQKLFVAKDIPLTVLEFLQLKEKAWPKISPVLEEVGLHRTNFPLSKIRLGALSGGELQRVLIAFALLGKPAVLLFDEPTSGIDISGEETVYALINKLQKEKNLTIVFISHELDIVYQHADTVLCLNKEKICFGPPRKVIDQGSLEALYGEEIRFYKHHQSEAK